MPLRLVVAHAEFKRDDITYDKPYGEAAFDAPTIEFIVYMLRHGQCILTVTGHPLIVYASFRGCIDEAGINYGQKVRQALRKCFIESIEDKDHKDIKHILKNLKDRHPDSYIHKGPNNAHR